MKSLPLISSIVLFALIAQGSALQAMAQVNSEHQSENLADKKVLRHKVKQLPVKWANALDNLDAKPVELKQMFSRQAKSLTSIHFDFSQLSELELWYARRKTTLAKSLHQVKNIQLEQLDDNSMRLMFEYVVQEQHQGLPVDIFRLQENWLIDIRDSEAPVVVEIIERYLPPNINSGMQIQC
ncbi:hypothetical protein [Thalassomonas sp. RHCl1]|uniref:hypothetical protein n=1 Tax=Thalassomonas sp. RHCl1 TaxID=2995320 RepID=UPI00248AC17C|nr:hypothetical protein [Thalassomonas sp. RHCl1]